MDHHHAIHCFDHHRRDHCDCMRQEKSHIIVCVDGNCVTVPTSKRHDRKHDCRSPHHRPCGRCRSDWW